MKNNKNEQFFAELAKAYVENDGIALEKELSEIKEEMKDYGINKKIKRKLLAQRAILSASMAASIIVIMLIYGSYTRPQQNYSNNLSTDMLATDNLRYGVQLLTASLPTGYTLTGVDYDNYAAIMEIKNEKNNHIVVTAEEFTDFYKDGLTEIEINGVIAYGIVKTDYCLLKYKKDDMLYTLTCLYEINDLIEISKSFL